MRVPNVDTGGIERGAERAVAIPRPGPDGRRGPDVADSAAISGDGRDRLEALERFAAQLRAVDPTRAAAVEAARARLASGALDHPDVYRAVAETLLQRS